jgi:hypothetical protein
MLCSYDGTREMCMRVAVRACVFVCVCARVRARARVCACVCARPLMLGGGRGGGGGRGKVHVLRQAVAYFADAIFAAGHGPLISHANGRTQMPSSCTESFLCAFRRQWTFYMVPSAVRYGQGIPQGIGF